MAQTGTLEDTLRDVIGDTPTPQSTVSKETNQETVASSDDTQSGGTSEKEFVGGVDISDVPEQDRPRIKELLSKKISLVEKGANEKFKEIAKYKKEKEELLSSGLTEDEASGVLREYLSKKTQTNTSKAENLRTLDKMIKESPAEQREALTNLRQIILEETSASELRKELDEIKRNVGIFNNERANSRVETINKSLNALSADYGKDFIDKYRDEIVKQGLAYPQAEVKRLITAIADPDDIEKAILSKASRKQNTNIDKKLAAITNTNSGMTTSIDNIDVKKETHKSLLGKLLAGVK